MIVSKVCVVAVRLLSSTLYDDENDDDDDDYIMLP